MESDERIKMRASKIYFDEYYSNLFNMPIFIAYFEEPRVDHIYNSEGIKEFGNIPDEESHKAKVWSVINEMDN